MLVTLLFGAAVAAYLLLAAYAMSWAPVNLR
jgi:hypothetical protein